MEHSEKNIKINKLDSYLELVNGDLLINCINGNDVNQNWVSLPKSYKGFRPLRGTVHKMFLQGPQGHSGCCKLTKCGLWQSPKSIGNFMTSHHLKSDHYLSTFIKKKKRPIKVAESYCSGTCPHCPLGSNNPTYTNIQ